ncbi:MAG: Spy/CpxP family protein refolding chaperone [Ignavibacteriales bacterium]|nr:Spy/CpxP family protein refolding chaperone [Ignavibacteriales bacterium]
MKQLMILLMLAASFVVAQPRLMDDDYPGTGMGHGLMIEKLDLKPDQEKQFKSFKSDLQKKQIDLRSKVQTMRIDLQDLTNEDTPNKSKIESKMGEISKLQNEMKLNHLDFWFSVNKILTPEQQKLWKDHPMKFGAGKGNGKGMKEDWGRPMRGRAHRGCDRESRFR